MGFDIEVLLWSLLPVFLKDPCPLGLPEMATVAPMGALDSKARVLNVNIPAGFGHIFFQVWANYEMFMSTSLCCYCCDFLARKPSCSRAFRVSWAQKFRSYLLSPCILIHVNGFRYPRFRV